MTHDDRLFPAGDAAPASPAQQRWRTGLCRAVDDLMTSAEGRDLLRWLLQAGRCFSAACPGPGTPAGKIYWEEGRRHVGVAVLRLLREADPSHLPRLFLTQEEDDARNGSDL